MPIVPVVAMPTVSVIIPTFSHRDYILSTLESVFAQTFTDYEVIVVNDGSPDDTEDLLRPHLESRRIRYFKQSNRGQAAARNRGIAEAGGEFIALLDDDDLWPADKLHWQVDAMHGDPALAMVAGEVELIDGSSNVTGRKVVGDRNISYESLFGGSPIWSPGQTLIRTSRLREIGGLDETIWGTDDYDLYLRLARRWTIRGFSRVALRYRVHPGNASRQANRMTANLRTVVLHQLRSAPAAMRRRLSRKAWRMLYSNMGQRVVWELKGCMIARDLKSTVAKLLELCPFAAPAVHDAVLFRELFRDLLPTRLRDILSHLRGRPGRAVV